MKLQEKEIKDDNHRGELLSIHSRLLDHRYSAVLVFKVFKGKYSAVKDFHSLDVQGKKLLTLSLLSHFTISL